MSWTAQFDDSLRGGVMANLVLVPLVFFVGST